MKSFNKAIIGLAAILLLANFSAYSASHKEAPLVGNYNFLLELDGVVFGRFASVDGLGAEIEVLEFREGGDEGVVRKIPGRTKYSDITLKRGYIATNDLWDWMQGIIDGDFVTKNASIRVLSKKRSEIVRFNLFNAWPIKYEVGSDDAGHSGIAIEELTLTVERIELE